MSHERDPLGRAVVTERDRLKAERSNWETTWQSSARWSLPQEATFTIKREPGTLRNRHVLDSTATTSLILYASSLHTLMNNPAFKWFRLGIEGLERPTRLQRRWLEYIEDVMLRVIARKPSNLYNVSHRSFLSLGAFGNSATLIERGPGGLTIRNTGMQDTLFRANWTGEIDSVFYCKLWDARQAAMRFGEENLSSEAKQRLRAEQGQAQQGQDSRLEYIHATFPADDIVLSKYLPERFRTGMFSHVGVWVDKIAEKTLEISPYFDFPWVTPRWYLADDETYGRGPGIDVLPDIRMANRMKAAIVRGAEKLADPPLQIPDGGLLSPVRQYPGGHTYTDGEIRIDTLIPPGASRIEVGDKLLQDTQNAIRQGYFNSLFATEEDSPVRTATEVLQRQGERNRALSPMLVRLHTEFYSPAILRVFNVLQRAGQIPEPPEDLRGHALTAEYISPLSASQGEAEALAVQRWFEQLAPWSQVDTGVFDWADTDMISQVLGELLVVPSKLVRSKPEVEMVRKAKQLAAEREQQAQTAQLGFQGAEAAAKMIAATNAGGE